MKWLLGIVLLICLAPGSWAQEEYIVNTRHIGVEEGLSHRTVYCIHQDRLGFIWMGTAYGLNRYDGYEFKRFTTASHGLRSNNIQEIVEDTEGFFWLMEWGDFLQKKVIKAIHLFHPITFETISFEEKFDAKAPLQPHEIRQISKLPDGRLLFQSLNARYWTYHPQAGFQRLGWPQGFQLVKWMTNGEIWGTLTPSELGCINESGDISQKIPLKNTNPVSEVRWQKNGEDSSLWILQPIIPNYPGALSTWQKGGLRDAFPFRQSGFLGPRSTGIFNHRASDQTIWYAERTFLWVIGFDGKLLFGDPDTPQNLTSKRIHQIFFDRQGLTWLATAEGVKMMRFEKSLFSKLGNRDNSIWEPGKGSTGTRGLVEINGKLLINRYAKSSVIDLATGRGYNHYEDHPPFDSKIKRRTNAPDRVGGPRTPLLIDRKGKLWTAGEGLISLDETGKEIKAYPLKKPGLRTWSLYQDVHHNIWMGLDKGMACFSSDIQASVPLFTKYQNFNSLEQALVVHFYEEQADKVWICSNNGLYLLHPQKGIQARFGSMEKGDNYLPAKDFHYIYQDREGVYWISTKNAGLLRWEPQASDPEKRLNQITREEGLPDNELYGIFEDEFNLLWISSANGLIHFDKETFSSRTYFQGDGISNNEFNRASYYQSDDGRIFFGSIDGVTAFYPKDFYRDLGFRQPLRLTAFQQYDGETQQLEDKSYQLGQEGKIILAPDDRFFSLKISLLDYLFSPKIKYEYLIDGLEQDWQSMFGNELTISGLPYGDYTLILRARGADGRLSTHQMEFPLEVHKPFYLARGFLAGMVLSVVFIVLLAVRLRTRRLIRRQKLLEAQVETRTRQIAEDKKTIEQQAEELRELDRQKSRFFTNISHEFRTPLTVISGMADMVEESEPRELIKRNSQSLLGLINQILDLRKLESGNLPLNMRQGDIVPYLKYLVESYQSFAESKGITLQFSTDIEAFVMDYDQEKLHSIVTNLISNAIKFTPEEGRVSLLVSGSSFLVQNSGTSAPNQEPETRNTLTITVKDSGIGIPPEKLPNIFDRFYQVDDSSTRQGEGTGIGLTLTRELIKALGGDITVSSKVGKGTCFEVKLPITQQAPKVNPGVKLVSNGMPVVTAEAASEMPAGSTNAFKLLIVEDNADVVRYLQACLRDAYCISIAKDGQEGIEKAIAEVPDIIISDVMMPRKDGFELCDTLKKDERTSHIPIILLTAKADAESRISGLRRGADAYLAKPFDKQELLVRLEMLVRLRRTLQERYAGKVDSLSPSEEQGIQQEDAFIIRLRDAILQHLDDPELNMPKLCEIMGTSRTQLHRKVTALTGKSASRFLRRVRMEEAQKLLKDPSLNISDIAYQVGFSDPGYFSKTFTEDFGISPSQARK